MLLLLTALILASPSNAAEKPKKKLHLTPPGQEAARKEDPGSATRLLYEDPRNANSLTKGSEKKLPTKVTGTCTDNMGMIYKSDSPGYDGCLRAFGNGTSPVDNKRPNSVGITIGK